MQDSVIKGTGNSRKLKTSLANTTTWQDALDLMIAGEFPIDLAGIEPSGFNVVGTKLNSTTLLSSGTEALYGLSNGTPDDAFSLLGSALRNYGNLADNTDLNTIFNNGFWYLPASAATTASNIPVAAAGYLVVMGNGTTRAIQFYMRVASGSDSYSTWYYRKYDGSVWTGWFALYATANINPPTLVNLTASAVSGQAYSDVTLTGVTTSSRCMVQRRTSTSATTLQTPYPVECAVVAADTLRVFWNATPSSNANVSIVVYVVY